MERAVLIIQARMGSKRLPGKSMMSLAGEPLISRLVERVKRCELLSDIVLAVPDTREDRVLRDLGESLGIFVYQGSEHDLVERYYSAAKLHRTDIVVRLPGDNPTPEPAEIDRVVSFHKELSLRGFSTNLSEVRCSGYPDGIGAEVFDFHLLEHVKETCRNLNAREHLHLNFYDYQTGVAVDETRIPVRTPVCPALFRRPELRLDVNTIEDYNFMSRLYKSLYPANNQFTVREIIEWVDTENSRRQR